MVWVVRGARVSPCRRHVPAHSAHTNFRPDFVCIRRRSALGFHWNKQHLPLGGVSRSTRANPVTCDPRIPGPPGLPLYMVGWSDPMHSRRSHPDSPEGECNGLFCVKSFPKNFSSNLELAVSHKTVTYEPASRRMVANGWRANENLTNSMPSFQSAFSSLISQIPRIRSRPPAVGLAHSESLGSIWL